MRYAAISFIGALPITSSVSSFMAPRLEALSFFKDNAARHLRWSSFSFNENIFLALIEGDPSWWEQQFPRLATITKLFVVPPGTGRQQCILHCFRGTGPLIEVALTTRTPSASQGELHQSQGRLPRDTLSSSCWRTTLCSRTRDGGCLLCDELLQLPDHLLVSGGDSFGFPHQFSCPRQNWGLIQSNCVS